MGSRADKRAKTLLALGNAAVSLFEAHGPHVTIDLIAKQAGVSRRTAFRHIRSKEELVYVHPVLWLDVFDAAVRDGATGKSRIVVGCNAIAEHIDLDPKPVRRAFMLALKHPTLMAGYDAVFQVWIQRIAKEFDPTPDSMERRMRAHVIGTAVMGAVNASTQEWLMAEGKLTFKEAFGYAFELVQPLLD